MERADEFRRRREDGSTRAAAAAAVDAAPAWHHLDRAAAVARLGSDARRGLSAAEAQRRLRQHGPNRLPAPPRRRAARPGCACCCSSTTC